MPLDLATLAVGDEIHHPLLVQEILVKGGDHPRTTLVFGNRSGRIESAPFWPDRAAALEGITKGMLVQVVGRVSSYRDASQLEVLSLRPLPRGSVPLSELAPSIENSEPYWQLLDEARDRLTAPRLRGAVDLFFADDVFRTRFEECPGSPGTGHHALIGGLLQHTCEVVVLARQMAKVARADAELVTAGAMLHDIGKLTCYTWETGVFDTTVRGRLNGHVAEGAMMFRAAWQMASPSPCTAEEALVLEHFILSHHGKLEFGAPVLPLTLEAQILSFADEASARTASIREAYSSSDLFAPEAVVSNRRVWQLDNRWLIRLVPDYGRADHAPSDDRKNEAADQSG